MVPENFARVVGPNLILNLIRPEDAAYFHALRTDPAYKRHLSVVRGTGEDQRRWSPDRYGVQKRLAEAGVGTLIHYPIPPHLQAAYADLGLEPDALPLARDLVREVLSLSIGPHLPRTDAAQVIDVVRAAD